MRLSALTARSLAMVLAFPLLLSSCGYHIKNLAKTDVDMVTDEFIAETRALVRELAVKLYGRNPDQLARVTGMTVEQRLQLLIDTPGELAFQELGDRQEIAALELVFTPDFTGDRVFALVVGLGGMLRNSYGYNTEAYIFDALDAEKLYTSARNIEILDWRLRNTRTADGQPYLITSEYQGNLDNLSFQRLFGKLIVLQDIMARIAGGAGNRTVTRAVRTASTVFIPMPL